MTCSREGRGAPKSEIMAFLSQRQHEMRAKSEESGDRKGMKVGQEEK